MTHSRFLLLALLLAAAACRRSPQPAPAPSPVSAPQQPADDGAAERTRLDSIARAEAARADSVARAESARRAREAATAALEALRQTVYFDYDADEIRDDAARILDAKVDALRSHAAIRLRIEGHTDERGSDEYNLALGQRRAAAVKRYLVARGIETFRMEGESYGEQRRACSSADNESCWQQNRRAEFTITAGAESITSSP
jgi:peptidoglycan-associated lipoprotein